MRAAALFAGTLAVFGSMATWGQDVIGPGSTPQGDILRGEGVYLRGRGLYELYSATGRSIDANTAIQVDRWNRLVHAAYLRERAGRRARRKGLTRAAEQQALREMAERESRLRINPTDEDVIRGDALNALLVDLCDPSNGPSVWRNAVVSLPPGLSIRSMFFRFAPRLGEKSRSLSGNIIALGRLDPSKKWPSYFPQDSLGAACRGYESTYKTLLDQCEKGDLQLETVASLDRALADLRSRVTRSVPAERGYRTAAERYVEVMQKATRIFDAETIDFAQEMIRDTHGYQPQTVAELLAFMRKYRLMFASAEDRHEDAELYRLLYTLLQEQKSKLGLPAVPEGSGAPEDPEAENALFRKGSVWSIVQFNGTTSRVTVLDRRGDRFRCRIDNVDYAREFSGLVRGNTISWLGKDVKTLRGTPGATDHQMFISGDRVELKYRTPNGVEVNGVLRLVR